MTVAPPRTIPSTGWSRRPFRIVERNVLAYRRMWYVFLSAAVEPIFFLLSIGIGVGKLVGGVQVGSQTVSYQAFVAPAMLATAAMMGAVLDTTFNFFFKYKYAHTYDAIIATPLGVRDIARGEISWALLRSGIYTTIFLITIALFGDISSPWAVLAVPVGVLIAFAFAGAGLAGATFMRSFVDFDYVNLGIIPMFLFSATFFPLAQYPAGIQAIVRLTPLYQGVVLERSLILGDVHWSLLANAAYLAVMGAVGLRIASRRLVLLLQK